MGTLFETLFGDILIGAIRRVGALIRWWFQPGKKYNVILKQNWNTRIGLLTISLITLISILIIRKF